MDHPRWSQATERRLGELFKRKTLPFNGYPEVAPLYAGLDLQRADSVEDAAFISVTGPVDDTVETPEDYRERLAAGVARDLELICANPDRVVQRGDQIIYCGGALADVYEDLGGRVIMAGKPFGPIYELAIEEAEALLGRPVDRSRVLCIGDGVVTDVLGANAQGLDCLVVAQGIHGDAAREHLGPGGVDPPRAFRVGLGSVDVGVGRAVHHDVVGAEVAQCGGHRGRVGDVDVG